jgi:hypothetical protein
MSWRAIYALPNLELVHALEGDPVVLAPADDSRCRELVRAQRTLRRYLARFSDAFGQRFKPPLLLLRTDAPTAYGDVGALASFRDAAAISTIAYARAQELLHPRGHRVLFGEAFAFYPWMVDRDDEDLIGSTPAILGMHEVEAFQGQSSPALFRTPLDSNAFDAPLFEAILARWRRRLQTEKPVWTDIALLRSLNMAYHATLMPAGGETTFYDVGRLISLWVSAFEILVHPGGRGQSNRDAVLDLMERIPWQRPACAALAHDTGGRQKIVKRTRASWLYQALYMRRNDFLHGNPVGRQALFLEPSGRNLYLYAAPLYRLALTAFLDLRPEAPPASNGTATLGAGVAARMEFLRPQRTMEEAIETALRPPEDQLVRATRTRLPPPAGPSA